MILATEFKKTATLRQKFLLRRLMKYANEEKRLQGIINSLEDSGSSNFYRQFRPFREMFYEKLEEIETKIKKDLQKAVEIGMDDVDVVKLNLNDYVRE